MAKLTTKARNKLSSKSFALAGRRYPIEDANHARNALSRVAQYGTASEKAKVRAAVHKKYPNIGRTVKGAWNAGDHMEPGGGMMKNPHAGCRKRG